MREPALEAAAQALARAFIETGAAGQAPEIQSAPIAAETGSPLPPIAWIAILAVSLALLGLLVAFALKGSGRSGIKAARRRSRKAKAPASDGEAAGQAARGRAARPYWELALEAFGSGDASKAAELLLRGSIKSIGASCALARPEAATGAEALRALTARAGGSEAAQAFASMLGPLYACRYGSRALGAAALRAAAAAGARHFKEAAR